MSEPRRQYRTWSMNSMSDWSYWTRDMPRIIITFIICGLLPIVFVCLNCDLQLEAHYIGRSNQHLNSCDEGWGYYCRPCNRYWSLRKGTVFENSKTHLKHWITALYHFTKNSHHLAKSIYDDCEQDGGWSKRRVYNVIYFFRNCIAKYFNDHLPKLGENGKEVQIDESAHNKKWKYHVGAYTPIRWVFGMYEKQSGWRKFVYVSNRTRATLLPIIKYYIEEGAQVVSDCWLAYDTLSDEGYEHYKVNHRYEFTDILTGKNTDSIEACWKWTKKFCLHDGGCLDRYLQLMLDCFSYRAMYLSNNEKDAFRIICMAIAETHHHFSMSD